jgi:rare lipoprotein A
VNARLWLLALLLPLLGACTAGRWETPPPGAPAPPPERDMTRSTRGNPPFYEVFGVRYNVLTSAANYSETGVASWYGKKFHGRPTSSGERYDMYQMTAAHKHLPLPTNARVTNLSNGKSVIVRINDRGPFVKNRLIDLSYAAAEQLDMIGDGTAMVRVEAIDTGYTGPISTLTATPPQAGRAPTAATAPPANRLFMQVGAFGEAANARNLAAQLTDSGIRDVSVAASAELPRIYRVRIGPVASVSEYDSIQAQVARLQITDTHLVVETTAANH